MELARKGPRPDFDVSFQYGQRNQRPDMITAQVSIPLPIHKRARQDQELAEARAELSAMESDRRTKINSVRAQVARLVSELERGRTQLAIYAKAILPQGSAAATAALASYQSGKTDLANRARQSEYSVHLRDRVLPLVIRLREEPGRARTSCRLGDPPMTRAQRVTLWTGAVVGAVLVVSALAVKTSRHTILSSSNSATGSTSAGQMSGMPGMSSTSTGSVVLTPTQIQQLGVTFGDVVLRPLSNEVRTVGTVVVNETRLAKVTPKFSGYVEKLYVNFVGQPVRRGEPLAAIFSPDLVAAEQELLVSARLSRTIGASSVPGVPGNNTDLLAAAKERLRLWDVSDAQINEVLATGRPMRTVTLTAPASGFVIDKKVVQGQSIQAGEELYTIADLSDVWVEAQLREEDAGRVGIGATATLQFTSYPGRPFTGRVTYIDPMLGEQARTVKARITVANSDGRIKPGMYATVILNSSTQSALTVPRSAVVQTGERALVFVDLGNGRLNAQTVRLGRTGGEYVEVLSGLTSGQRVVTSAQFLIDSESNLGEVMKSMIGCEDKATPCRA